MATKPKDAWVDAPTEAEKKAAVMAHPELRHVYAQAFTIYTSLTDEEKSAKALTPETIP